MYSVVCILGLKGADRGVTKMVIDSDLLSLQNKHPIL